MKRKVLKILLYVIGIVCIVYPIYSRFLAYKNQTESIYDYKKELAIMQEEELKEKLKKSEEFNASNSSETSVVDPSTITAKEDDAENSSYNFLQLGEMIGFISIPKINIELPIYEGVTVNNLTKGVAHMENTSLPNGNLNTHSVLAGHTGISQAEIFDNISELKVDDEFYITFYNETTKYKVVYETVVLPENTNDLKVENGRCLVTLVTCTPKTVNTHRLLVTGEKVEDDVNINEGENEEKDESNNNSIINNEIVVKSDLQLFIDFVKRNSKLFIALLVLVILLIILNVVTFIKNRINKKDEGE